MGAAGAAGRDMPAQGQDPAPGSTAHALGHPLAAPERRQVAEYSRRARALVEGGADIHPLGASRGSGSASFTLPLPSAAPPMGKPSTCFALSENDDRIRTAQRSSKV